MSKTIVPQDRASERALTRRQKQFVDHILTTGQSVIDSAATLGTNPTNIWRELRKSHVKKYLMQRTLDHIGVLAPIAARIQSELLSSDSDHVRANVAENILDRHLGKPVMRSQVQLQGTIRVHIDLG